MIWIANHGITGASDNLRLPLSLKLDSIETHESSPESSPAVINGHGPWTGVAVGDTYDAIRDGFTSALGTEIVFADEVDADHQNYDSKAAELDAYYDGTHPNL